MALPWSAALDVSYVGNHGFNRVRAFQGGANGSVDLNAVDIGAAYLPQNQDPTLGPSSVPGASAYTTNLLRPFRGYSNINEQETRVWDAYHGLQVSLNRRCQNGLAIQRELQSVVLIPEPRLLLVDVAVAPEGPQQV